MSANIPISLVKFLSASSGLSVLKDETIRWSAPHAFLDPFENKFDSDIGFDQNSFTEAAIKQITAMLFTREDPTGQLTPIKKAVKRWRTEQRFRSEEEASEALLHLLPTMVKKHFEEIDALHSRWRLYAFNARMLCLSDNFRDIGLWQTRANNHRGIAIRFKVGKDHSFQKPLKVHYRTNRTTLFSLVEEIELFMGTANSDRNTDLESRYLKKSKQFINQKEWRCITRARKPMSPDNPGSAPLYEMKPFDTEEVMAIYIGLLFSKNDKLSLINILEERYPDVKIYVARMSDQDYEIEFDQMDIEGFKESVN